MRSKAAILRLTRNEGRDPIDDSEMNAVRREALALMARDDDDLNDAELFARQATDDYWYVELCLSQLHQLPSEVDRILTCREYTTLQAHSLITQARTRLNTVFKD
jgi:hypothetical protein